MRKFSVFLMVTSILLAIFFIGLTAQITSGDQIWWGLSKESAHYFYLPCIIIAFISLIIYLKSED
ncbi:hypothetical protein DFP97_11627 [Paenibacillus prosopidis]|uniref:Uncharacterized protein n=1 Tax=Paenibacillus prosopidis TaxID=630520 RepID=A0A368VN97_9BACL|nr:hypothetical protein DFP97_11627 [Paenibacillus prosopidis]